MVLLNVGPMGPMGPQGPWAQPLFEPVAELFRFFNDFGRPKNKKCDISWKLYCCKHGGRDALFGLLNYARLLPSYFNRIKATTAITTYARQ